MEHISENDWNILKLLAEDPSITTTQIAHILGVSRQAVSKRIKRLKEKGFLRKYVYLDILSMITLTKKFKIYIREDSLELIKEVFKYLSSSWRIVAFWTLNRNTIEGIVLIDNTETFKRMLIDEFPFISRVEVEAIRIWKLLGGVVKEADWDIMYKIAKNEATKIFKSKSVKAVLYKIDLEDNVISLLVIRDNRLTRYGEIRINRTVKNTCLTLTYTTYSLLKEKIRRKFGRMSLKGYKLLRARDVRDARRIKRFLRLVSHL